MAVAFAVPETVLHRCGTEINLRRVHNWVARANGKRAYMVRCPNPKCKGAMKVGEVSAFAQDAPALTELVENGVRIARRRNSRITGKNRRGSVRRQRRNWQRYAARCGVTRTRWYNGFLCEVESDGALTVLHGIPAKPMPRKR